RSGVAAIIKGRAGEGARKRSGILARLGQGSLSAYAGAPVRSFPAASGRDPLRAGRGGAVSARGKCDRRVLHGWRGQGVMVGQRLVEAGESGYLAAQFHEDAAGGRR